MHEVADALLVLGVEVGVQERDGDRLDPAIGQVADRADDGGDRGMCMLVRSRRRSVTLSTALRANDDARCALQRVRGRACGSCRMRMSANWGFVRVVA